MLPPPTSKKTPFSTGRPAIPPRRPWSASCRPSMTRMSIPVSRRTRSMSSAPLAASRMAAVATATTRVAPPPRAMAAKSRRASSARSTASGPRAWPASTSLTSRSEARVVETMRRTPAASRR